MGREDAALRRLLGESRFEEAHVFAREHVDLLTEHWTERLDLERLAVLAGTTTHLAAMACGCGAAALSKTIKEATGFIDAELSEVSRRLAEGAFDLLERLLNPPPR